MQEYFSTNQYSAYKGFINDKYHVLPGCLITMEHDELISPGQNGRHFADDIFKYICMNESVSILIKISLKFVAKGPIDINPVLA